MNKDGSPGPGAGATSASASVVPPVREVDVGARSGVAVASSLPAGTAPDVSPQAHRVFERFKSRAAMNKDGSLGSPGPGAGATRPPLNHP